jgi:hypothetical protein
VSADSLSIREEDGKDGRRVGLRARGDEVSGNRIALRETDWGRSKQTRMGLSRFQTQKRRGKQGDGDARGVS